jgi:hypothetical protein
MYTVAMVKMGVVKQRSLVYSTLLYPSLHPLKTLVWGVLTVM